MTQNRNHTEQYRNPITCTDRVIYNKDAHMRMRRYTIHCEILISEKQQQRPETCTLINDKSQGSVTT